MIFYHQQLNHFLKYCELQMIKNMGDITAVMIREFLSWHESTGHNAGGLHATYRTVKVFLWWYELEAEPDNWKNPIRKVKAPKVELDPLEPIELESVSKLILTCAGGDVLDLRDKAIFLFLLDTGTRARELTALNIQDVNQITGEVTILHGKGNKPRTLFVGKSTRRALRAYLKLRRDNLPALWATDNCDRLSYRGLDSILKRRSAKAGIGAPMLHAFRRAFAINMLRAGVDLITLARLMGHTSLTILQRYLKQIPDDLRAAHDRGSPVDRLI
jgi:integrase/recombinase XerD